MFNPSPVAPKPDLQPLSAPRVKGLKISLGVCCSTSETRGSFPYGKKDQS